LLLPQPQHKNNSKTPAAQRTQAHNYPAATVVSSVIITAVAAQKQQQDTSSTADTSTELSYCYCCKFSNHQNSILSLTDTDVTKI